MKVLKGIYVILLEIHLKGILKGIYVINCELNVINGID